MFLPLMLAASGMLVLILEEVERGAMLGIITSSNSDVGRREYFSMFAFHARWHYLRAFNTIDAASFY